MPPAEQTRNKYKYTQQPTPASIANVWPPRAPQGVWSFPPRYLTGIATLDGWLKLDIAAVYLVSTLAVTATGAIILAASEEFVALRAQQPQQSRQPTPRQPPQTELTPVLVGQGAAGTDGGSALAATAAPAQSAVLERPAAAAASVASVASAASASTAGLAAEEPGLWELGLFIFDNAAPGVAAPLERVREAAVAAGLWRGDESEQGMGGGVRSREPGVGPASARPQSRAEPPSG